MELFKTGEEFLIHGVPHPNIPFILDKEFQEVTPANKYLYFISVISGKCRSSLTWQRYAECLKSYFLFLETNNIDWRDSWSSDTLLIVSWRQMMLNTNKSTSYINQQLNQLSRFFNWCVSQKIIGSSPFPESSNYKRLGKKTSFLAHTIRSTQELKANILALREFEKPIKFLNIEQVPTFISTLTNKRDRLIASLMFEAGLRRSEAVYLNKNCLPKLGTLTPGYAAKIELDANITQTKGKKSRWVTISYELASKIYQYIAIQRAKNIGRNSTEHNFIFVNAQGNPLSKGYINGAFEVASTKSNIKCTPHMLRHTFGTYELYRLKDAGENEGNALLWIRDRMGHSSVSTTERYLHLLDKYNEPELERYQQEIDSLIIDGNSYEE